MSFFSIRWYAVGLSLVLLSCATSAPKQSFRGFRQVSSLAAENPDISDAIGHLAQIDLAMPQQPLEARLLGNDDGFGGGHAQTGQVAAGLEPAQEDRQERRLARFPLAGQECDLPRPEIAVPQPGKLGVVALELVAPVAGQRGRLASRVE